MVACFRIQNKAGAIVVVPVHIWENGLKLDTDWHVYAPPVVAAPVAPLEVVELKKPLPIPEEIAKKPGKRKGK
jgi:hypothetical protein